MKTEPGEFGGTTVTLTEGDRLEDVPASHQHLISDEICAAFVDPRGHLKSVIDRCPFESMHKWLSALHSDGEWELEVHRWNHDESGEAGFWWVTDKVRGACIHPALEGEFPESVPDDLRSYYELVDKVDWNGVGAGGTFFGANGQMPLSCWEFEPHGADIDPEETYVWGDSPCGDMMIWTVDDRAGWFNLPSHKVHLLGSISDTINWMYTQLIEFRCPGWDYDAWK